MFEDNADYAPLHKPIIKQEVCMTSFHRKPTQEERILSLLKARGDEGLRSWEIVNQMNILQYTARIWGLRDKGHNIKNVKKNLYVLIKE